MTNLKRVMDNILINTTYIPKIGLSFNQFVIECPDKSLVIIETGMRANFNTFHENICKENLSLQNLNTIIIPHFEVDEMGALPEFLSHSKKVNVFAHPICSFGLNDIFKANCKPAFDKMELNIYDGCTLKFIHTKHVHQWDSMVIYWIEKKVLFSSDLFIQHGKFEGISNLDKIKDIKKAIVKDEYLPSQTHFRKALSKLSAYDIEVIMPMHGSSLGKHTEKYISDLLTFQFE